MKAIAAKTVVSLRDKPTERVCLDDELLYGMTAEILEEVPALQEGAISEDIGDRKGRPVSEAEPDIGAEGRTVIQTEPVPGNVSGRNTVMRRTAKRKTYSRMKEESTVGRREISVP